MNQREIPYRRSFADADTEVGFLKQDNLTNAFFQKWIFGMGKYDKVIIQLVGKFLPRRVWNHSDSKKTQQYPSLEGNP